ncbi:MAG: hypothetical protein JWQ32_1004 [Marmoricola sp.]|nr:hypothetical protein [Marmoricola sp.]
MHSGAVDDEPDQDVAALGWVPLEGRGSLPFALVHGESLVAAASWAVGEAGVQLYDASVSWAQVRGSGRTLLVHDPLCPLAPADFLADAARIATATGQVVVGFRPVTDTIKELRGEVFGVTVDRDGLRSVATPVVIPAAVLAGLDDPGPADLPTLVAQLAAAGPVHWLEAPSLARRIHDLEELALLEALSRSQV